MEMLLQFYSSNQGAVDPNQSPHTSNSLNPQNFPSFQIRIMNKQQSKLKSHTGVKNFKPGKI